MRFWAPVAILALAACESPRRAGGPMNPGTRSDASPAEKDAAQDNDGGMDAALHEDAGDADAFAFDAPTFDAQPRDADPTDFGFRDAEPIDFGFRDADPIDFGFRDADPVDVGFPPDLGPADLGVWPDAAIGDAGLITDAGTPACTSDSQCASGRCHPLYSQCVPPSQLPQCANCTSHSQCGMPSDHCLDVSVGGTYLETICAQACRSATDCPRGYGCTLNGHCYPISGSIRAHTCWSLADMLASESCDPFGTVDACGVPTYDDGTCVPTLGCAVGCNTNADCPEGSTCSSFFVANYCVAD